MTRLEKLEAVLDQQAMEYGEAWHKVKQGEAPRLAVLEKELEVLTAAQQLYLARRRSRKNDA